MLHALLRCPPGAIYYCDHRDAAVLWALLARELVGLAALLLLPDRLHVVAPHADVAPRLVRVVRRYSELRHHRGSLPEEWPRVRWEDDVPDAIRRIHCGPARLGLVNDPLAWPWGTHRDYCGVVASPVVPAAVDPARFHRKLTAGLPVADLPRGRACPRDTAAVDAALSAVFRLVDITRAGHPLRVRVMLLAHVGFTPEEIGARVRRRVEEVRRILDGASSSPSPDLAYEAALRVLGDARFPALDGADQRRQPAWSWYVSRMRLRADVDAAALAAGHPPADPFQLNV